MSVASEVEFAEDSLDLCTGSTITLDAGYGFDYYIWSTGEFGVQSIDVTTGGKYFVDVNYYFGCPSTDTIIVTEYPVAVASITGDDMFCADTSIVLYAPVGDFDYTWYFNDSPVSNETSIIVTQGGNYKVMMENLCGQNIAEKSFRKIHCPMYISVKMLLCFREKVLL